MDRAERTEIVGPSDIQSESSETGGRWCQVQSSTEIRPAVPGDVAAIARLFQETYPNSSHPCTDEAILAGLLASRRMQMLVAVREGRVIGSTAANLSPVPGIMEIGSLLVERDHQKLGLSIQLHYRIVDHILRDPQCDLVVAFIRGPSIYRLGNQHPTLSLKAWGHDGGMNIAQEIREHHVVAIAANPNRAFRRALPAEPVAVVERALKRIPGLTSAPCEPVAFWAVTSQWPQGSGQVVSCTELPAPAPGGTAAEALDFVREQSNAHRHIPHQHVFAAFERRDFIYGLKNQGFRPTAYLPAWAIDHGIRRDCVLMAKTHPGLSPAKRGMDCMIDAWDRRLAGI
jgi:hypothetical protein